jgi:hypothetical protein
MLLGLLGACTLTMSLPASNDPSTDNRPLPAATVYTEKDKCQKFVLPIEPEPPHIPLDQFAKSNQTKRTDILVEHIKAVKAHDIAYRKTVQDAFKVYQDSCN